MKGHFTMYDHIAFDIETTGLESEDAITCCATRKVVDGTVTDKVWHSNFADEMDTSTLADMIDSIYADWLSGCTVVTFNGAKFDFQMVFTKLAGTAHEHKVRELAQHHCDIMFQFAVTNGYFASMNSFAQGTGLAPKTWNGADASQAWQNQPRASKQAVLDYCAEDVRCLSDLYLHICEFGSAGRVTKRGNKRIVPFETTPDRLPSVANIAARAATAQPDTSWMTDPPDVLAGIAWLNL